MSPLYEMPCDPVVHGAAFDPRVHQPEHHPLYDFPLLDQVLGESGFEQVEDPTGILDDRHTEGWSDVIPQVSLVVRAVTPRS